MPVLRTQKIESYYDIKGAGPPLLLIAGFSCHSLVWNPLREFLTPHYTVITIDNRGVGRSSCPDDTYTLEEMSNDCLLVLNHLSIGKCHVLGHSMGGAIAQYLAFNHPDRIEKLILSNTSMRFSQTARMMEANLVYLFEQNIPLDKIIEFALPFLYSSNFLEKKGVIELLKQEEINNPYPQSLIGLKRQIEALNAFDSRKWCHKISAKTLIIGSQEDIICLGEAEQLHQNLPQSKLVIFPTLGHIPFVENLRKFTDEIFSFLIS